jgi:hypothetical protein
MQNFLVIYYFADGYLMFLFTKEYGHGHYGFNCNKSCDGCLSDACDRQFGTCTNTSGCKPGRQSGLPMLVFNDLSKENGKYFFSIPISHFSCPDCLPGLQPDVFISILIFFIFILNIM